MSNKYGIHDHNILKRRKLHTSYKVSLYLDYFDIEEGAVHDLDNGYIAAIGGESYKITRNRGANKLHGKFNLE